MPSDDSSIQQDCYGIIIHRHTPQIVLVAPQSWNQLDAIFVLETAYRVLRKRDE